VYLFDDAVISVLNLHACVCRTRQACDTTGRCISDVYSVSWASTQGRKLGPTAPNARDPRHSNTAVL
jgi:hypothetical protein